MSKLKSTIIDFMAKLRIPFHLKYWRWIRLSAFVILDVLTITFSCWGAFALRLDHFWPETYETAILSSGLALSLISIPIFSYFGMYRQVWRYASFSSAVLIGKSAFVSCIVGFVGISLLIPEIVIPRSVPPIYFLLTTTCLCFIKFSWRALATYQAKSKSKLKERCLIYGAGSGGDILARHIKSNPEFPYHIVGFIDDDPHKKRRIIHGFKIVGSGQNLSEQCKKFGVATVLIAMPSAKGKAIRKIVQNCHSSAVKPLILPGLTSTLTDEPMKPRPVDVADLLRRSPKQIDQNLINEFFHDSTVLITGAGGSIGSELARQVIKCQPKRIILLDHSEFNLYKIDLELREDPNLDENIQINSVLGSVTDARQINHVFELHSPTVVLHAAAYKHVPMIEANPIEGALNNIKGTKTVAEAAIKYGVKRFLLISTDKAVRPTNIMGSTKRVCELLVNAYDQLHQSKCRFCLVRFGNVLGSSGSVIPRFMEQISQGGPVTVTHPDVTRYFMITEEAVGLVLQAISMSSGGETFVLNMGEPIKIYDMAQDLIRLAGKEPGSDIEINITGMRPGEKLFEELILEGSEKHTLHDEIFIAIPENNTPKEDLAKIDKILLKAENNESAGLIKLLRTLALSVADPSEMALPMSDLRPIDPPQLKH